MATIKARKQANGEMRYTAIVRIRSAQKVVHSESKTFGYRTAANTWAKKREVALEDPDELKRAQEEAKASTVDRYQLRQIIRWYIDSFREIANWGRTKQSTLEFLERHSIGEADARELTTPALVQHVKDRRASGAGPSTAANDLIWIGVVLRAAKSAEGLRVNLKPENVRDIDANVAKPRQRRTKPAGPTPVELPASADRHAAQ